MSSARITHPFRRQADVLARDSITGSIQFILVLSFMTAGAVMPRPGKFKDVKERFLTAAHIEDAPRRTYEVGRKCCTAKKMLHISEVRASPLQEGNQYLIDSTFCGFESEACTRCSFPEKPQLGLSPFRSMLPTLG